MKWNDYPSLSDSELEHRIEYDLFLMKQPSIHTCTHRKIVVDRQNCEAELEKRRVKKKVKD